uniref:C3H1-type domain-containing protein n=1 Tax=Ditylenchus dipsaci TaxID=166011 RepID=A0A915D3B2_9BILA
MKSPCMVKNMAKFLKNLRRAPLPHHLLPRQHHQPHLLNQQQRDQDKKCSENINMMDDNVIHLDQNDLNYGDEDEDFQEEYSNKPTDQCKFSNEPAETASLDDILLEKITAISSSEDDDSDTETIGKQNDKDSKTLASNPLVEDSSQLIIQAQKEKKPVEDAELEDGELTESDSDESEIAVIKGSTGLSPIPAPVPPQLPMVFDCTRPPILFPMQPRGSYVAVKASERSPDVGVCKFYLRGACTWGEGCKFFHPAESDKPYWVQKLHITRPLITSPFTGARVIQTTNLCKPSPVTYSVPNFATGNRGLRQARELVNKKAGVVEKGKGRASEDNIDGFPANQRRDSESPGLASPSSFQSARLSRRSLTAGQSTEESEERAGGRKQITAPFSGSTSIPSLIDDIRSPESGTPYSQSRRNSNNRQSYAHKEDRYVKSSGRRTRSQSSASEEDEQVSRNSRKLKSLVSPVFTNSTSSSYQRSSQHHHRLTLISKHSEFSDPWARDRRIRSKSPSRALNPAQLPTTTNPKPKHPQPHQLYLNQEKVEVTLVLLCLQMAPLLHSPATMRPRAIGGVPEKSQLQKAGKGEVHHQLPRFLRLQVGPDHLHMILREEGLTKGVILPKELIPTRKTSEKKFWIKHFTKSRSPNSSDEEGKALKAKKLDVAKFFEHNEQDAPAAYRHSTSTTTKPSSSQRNRRRTRSSSTSSTGSSSSSGTSSRRRQNKNKKVDTKRAETHKKPVVRMPSPEADPISSDGEDNIEQEKTDAKRTIDFQLKKQKNKKKSSNSSINSSSSSSQGNQSKKSSPTPPPANDVDIRKRPHPTNLDEDDEIDAALESVCTTTKQKDIPAKHKSSSKVKKFSPTKECKEDEESQKRQRKKELMRQLKQVDEAIKQKKQSIPQA